MKKIIGFVLLLGVLACLFSCDSDEGKHFNEWVEKNGNMYYYDGEGKKQKGWFEYNSNWFYFNPSSGKMSKNQWIEKKYYVDEQGKMLINTTKEIGGTKYSFDKKGVGEVWQKFKITLDKELPYTYEEKYSDGDINRAWELMNFSYEVNQNYATKNNDVTIKLKVKLIYSWIARNSYNGKDYASFTLGLLDENGIPASIDPIRSLSGTYNIFDKLTGGVMLYGEGDVKEQTYTFNNIKDGQYTLVFDGD